MMRVFYLVAIVLTIAFMVVDVYYAEEVSSARYDSYFDSYNSYDYDNTYGGYSDYSYSDTGRDDELTVEGGIVTMVFFFFYMAVYLLSLMKIKTTTMKVFSIIGMSLTGIMLAWDALIITSPGSLSFDEVAPAWIFFGLAMLAFSIIGTVHAFKKKA
jgi:hypothetical protein